MIVESRRRTVERMETLLLKADGGALSALFFLSVWKQNPKDILLFEAALTATCSSYYACEGQFLL
jgi:hypothetical protein